LIVKNLTLEDEAQYTCRIGDRETSCKLMVDEGRSCDSDTYHVTYRVIFNLENVSWNSY